MKSYLKEHLIAWYWISVVLAVLIAWICWKLGVVKYMSCKVVLAHGTSGMLTARPIELAMVIAANIAMLILLQPLFKTHFDKYKKSN